MRNSLLRKAVACCGLAVVAAAALTGCGDDDSGTAASTTAKAAATSAAPATTDAATTKAISDVYTTFFNPATPADRKAAIVQNGSTFLPLLQAQAGNPQAQGTSVTVSGVTLVDASNANVKYTLLMGGNPVLPDQNGQAVKEGGEWKVATATFCALLMLQGGTSPAC